MMFRTKPARRSSTIRAVNMLWLAAVFPLTQTGAFELEKVSGASPVGFRTINKFRYDSARPFDGWGTAAGLTQATDGNVYGTVPNGGPLGGGGVFKLRPGGGTAWSASFCGAAPYAALTEGPDGLYGTSEFGVNYFSGGIFRMSADGTCTVLHEFGNEPQGGTFPQGALVFAGDGNFYGTTTAGGQFDKGTLFRMSPTGQVTLLHSFSGADGQRPSADMIQSNGGDLYSVAQEGGEYGSGVVFKLNISGQFTLLHSFDGSDGALPTGLIQASDGFFYGTTYLGGIFRAGVAFSMTGDGTVTPLHDFLCWADGCGPRSLVQAKDGNFYGAASSGGLYSKGTVYQMTSAGVVTVLHSFRGVDGSSPSGRLLEATDGRLYGTTLYGGINDSGTVFTLFRRSPSR